MDDYSRYTWLFLLKTKDQTVKAMIVFINMVLNQFNTAVKVIRTDNGKEFINIECQKLFQEKGILHQKSCPYTPQQNEVVERKHRTLLNVTRALMMQLKVLTCFWGEAVTLAANIINVIPSKKLKWKTPFEKLHKEKPNYNTFYVFGSRVYYINNVPHKGKLANRANPRVYMGFLNGQKGHKIWDENKKSFIISRDLVFVEEEFPFVEGTRGKVANLAPEKPSSIGNTDPIWKSGRQTKRPL